MNRELLITILEKQLHHARAIRRMSDGMANHRGFGPDIEWPIHFSCIEEVVDAIGIPECSGQYSRDWIWNRWNEIEDEGSRQDIEQFIDELHNHTGKAEFFVNDPKFEVEGKTLADIPIGRWATDDTGRVVSHLGVSDEGVKGVGVIVIDQDGVAGATSETPEEIKIIEVLVKTRM